MNRQHVSFVVDDLAAAVHFYSTMFATGPSVLMPDYATWMLDEPRVNFAIRLRGGASRAVWMAIDNGRLISATAQRAT
ncbi:MAG: hypothetical protein ROZ09_06235 [Thiobacillus sp.]|jgi:catechol 2,3-dioxygenase-like lactoylglutathione lyase family enzyme|uniref:hypothetical protein n=1 Tax=Thiobacillus sp. TaxID=924 RepID=UPI002895A9F8|nr:hypothetical protein [Thiobacillus sp.]MDT3706408.1 hypothetical protein [Thiobacillus sp.]